MMVSAVSGDDASMGWPSPAATSRSSECPERNPASPCAYLTISSSPASVAWRSSREADSLDRWLGLA